MNQYEQDFAVLEPDSPRFVVDADTSPPNLSGRLNTPIVSNFQGQISTSDSLPGGISRNTLNESVMDSILRDLYEVAGKTRQVLIPTSNKNALKEC
ncbi:hypothetical protein AYI68_g5059 [Smittium mucronatum]|uniref:Uncharacterized protein n=1 Tax=Smittium mucronatum TaxID=133383 RepID=A0A1R0GVD7_9FUNG|nr:hypothetical protein AYI68_g5059 [Smittium mucronatum]